MWEGVSVAAKPAALLPITVARLKTRLRIDDTAEDAEITAWLNGAISMIDGPNGIGYAMMTQSWQKSMDCFPSTIVLPGAPIKSVTSITYIDTAGTEQTLDSADYRVDLTREPVRITPAYGTAWPSTRDVTGAVVVEYVVGEADSADVPADLVDAVTLIAGHRFRNREAVANSSLKELPLGVQNILDRHRRSWVAA